MPTRAIAALTGLTAFVVIAGCRSPEASARPGTGVVYQTSTINALLEGVYDDNATCGDVRRRGDLGIGTFGALDGEMILLDGRMYQVNSSGAVAAVPDATTTPLAIVVPFRPAMTAGWTKADVFTYAALQAQLDQLAHPKNVPLAIRIDGEFALVRTRSVPRQQPPYRGLSEVVKSQSEFESRQVRGTLVGFWFPKYLGTVNVPGYHFHFVSSDRTFGGHVLECQLTKVTVQVQACDGLEVRFPRSTSFREANLDRDASKELLEAEK